MSRATKKYKQVVEVKLKAKASNNVMTNFESFLYLSADKA